MAASTLESFLNPRNPLTKRDRRCSFLSSSFSVRFEPVLNIPHTATTTTTTTCRTWANISIVARHTSIINVSPPKLGSPLGTCFLSLDPVDRCRFNSRLVVAVPFASADDDSGSVPDEHSEIDDDVENDEKISSASDGPHQIEVLLNAAEDQESQEGAVNYWRQIKIVLVDSFKEYLIPAENKSPEEVIKDIIIVACYLSSSSSSSSTDIDHHQYLKLDASSKLQDFYLGIPYGALLSLGGFLSFMLTGSISGIRFGVILGGTLLALSISSLRYSYATKRRRDHSSALQAAIMKLGQAAIAGIIFLRHLGLLFQRPSFPNSFTALISGGMVVFYLYTIMLDGGQKQKIGT